MPTINSVNNSLTGSTGTGSFVGSDSAVLTGNVDFSGASEVLLPNSANPTLSSAGQIAVDASVTGYPGLLNFHSGTEVLNCLGMLEADLSAVDTHVVKYNSAGQKLVMGAHPGSAGSTGKLQQYIMQTFSINDSTTSTSAANTSITASITPTNASSIIYITCCGYNYVGANGGGSTAQIFATYELRRTTGTAATLISYQMGKNLQDTSSASFYPYYSQLNLSAYETAGNTNLHTYIIRHHVPTSLVTSNIRGDISPSIIILMELLP